MPTHAPGHPDEFKFNLFELLLEKKSCWSIWLDPKTVFEPDPNPKNSLIWPRKAKQIYKSDYFLVRMEENLQNESCSFTLVEPYYSFFLLLYLDPNNSPIWPNKDKKTQK